MDDDMPREPDVWIRRIIEDFIRYSPENTLQNLADDKAFEDPLVGYARGDDPLFETLKEHVGPFHWTPQDIFEQTSPGLFADPGDLTVISWVLPQTKAAKEDNRRERFYPSERWARARIFGEMVNVKLRKHVVERLDQQGYRAVAPQILPQWERKTSEKYGFASTWSERHVAHICGLGTFGLCDGLITPKGKAVRLGSVVARISVPVAPRPYSDHHAYCIFLTRGLCGECISRCPVGALSKRGHDKMRCREHIRPVTQEYVKSHFGFDGYGCGLCQTGVPCESKIPAKEDLGTGRIERDSASCVKGEASQ
jgi:epoxyqueuosine reductase